MSVPRASSEKSEAPSSHSYAKAGKCLDTLIQPQNPPLHPTHTAFKNLFNEAEYTKKRETDALLKESAARNIMRKSLLLLSMILRVEDVTRLLALFSID